MVFIRNVIHCLKEDNQHLTPAKMSAEVCLEIDLRPQHLLEPIIEKIYKSGLCASKKFNE